MKSQTKLSLSFSDLPELTDLEKRKLALHSWEIYQIKDNQYFIVTDGGCQCCYGNLEKRYLITNDQGKTIRSSNYEEFCKIEVIQLVQVNLPDYLKTNSLRFSIT